MPRRRGFFGVVLKLLVQPLTRTRPDDLDCDVLAGAMSRKADHLASKVDDLDGLAHVEQEDLAFFRHGARLQHETDRFLDRHEVARHLRIGHGDRTALDDLTEERRYDAAPTPENVSEPNRGERQAVLGPDGQYDELRGAFARAHHRAGLRGFVSGDVHEAGAVLARDAREVPGSEDIRLHGLGRVCLEDRNMFEGRGVEYDVGSMTSEDFA